MARTRMAIVGLGLAVAPHARALRELGDRIEVVCGATRSTVRAQEFANGYGFAATTDVADVVSDPGIDALLVLTPANTHLNIARAAFASGKHVLMEKPLDASLENARMIVAGASERGVTLGVVLQHRFRDAALRLAEILAAGELGKIEAASMTVHWWREQAYYNEPGRGTRARDGGGVLMTQAIHTLDLFRSLVQPVDVVAAQARTTGLHRMETEDYVGALVRVGDGAPGSVVATTAFYPGDPERIEIVGSKGTARIVGNDLSVRYLTGRCEDIVGNSGTGGSSDPMAFSHEPHRRLIEDFVDAIAERRRPRVSGAEALRSQELIEAILSAARLEPPRPGAGEQSAGSGSTG